MLKTFCCILLGLVLAVMSGCANPQQNQRWEQDLAEMKRRLAVTEQDLVALGQNQAGGAKADDFNALSRRQADLQADFDSFRSEFQAMAGQIDEQRTANASLQADLTMLRDEVALKNKLFEERLGESASAPQSSAPPAPVVPPPASAAPVPAVQQPSLPAPAPVSAETALYQQGLDAIRQEQDFPKGRKILDSFVQQHPKHALVVNARYWIGEAWYGEKKYENAILQFQDVIQDYGDHPKVAAALLKQALAFQSLGDDVNAKVLLGKVIDSFPESPEAKKAEARLKVLE